MIETKEYETAVMNDSAEIIATDTPDRPVLKLDPDLYQEYLDDAGLSETDRQEFLTTLWAILCQFAELGYRIHPVQSATGIACGEIPLLSGLDTVSVEDALNPKNTSITTFLNAAASAANKEES